MAEWFKSIEFITIIDFLGTFAFAISGIRLASAKKFDWFGAFVVGMVTAVGGGTMRDLLLGVVPFWMENGFYILVSAFSLLFVLIFQKYLVHINSTIFIFDAIGLGLFTVVGLEKALDCSQPMWVAIIMGSLTGAGGGMLRDMMINEIPLIFRADIYAVASIIGGVIYWFCLKIGLPDAMTQLITAISVISIRVVSARYHLSIPMLNGEKTDGPDIVNSRKLLNFFTKKREKQNK